jgi:flagellar assembly protein FliH
MPVVRRFEFDLSFDAPRMGAPMRKVEPEPQPEPEPPMLEPEPEPEIPPEPTFSQSELDAAFERGLSNGRQAGELDAMERIERRLADTTERLSYQLKDLAEHHSQAIAMVERQATEATLAALRKLFPAFLARGGATEIQAMLTEAFEHAIEEPRILVRTAPGGRGSIEPMIRDMAGQAGFDGKLIVIEDTRLGDMDCRIEWAEGGVERNPRRLLDAIEAAVARGLADFDRRHASDGLAAQAHLQEAAQ